MKKIKALIVLITILSLSMTQFIFADGESDVINSAGYGSTYVIRNDGSLWGWGFQYVGNGTGRKEAQLTPVKILDNVNSVSTSSRATVAVKKDGSLWGWGSLVDYPTGDVGSPTEIYPAKLLIDDVKAAAVSSNFILALKNDNTLWVCGSMTTGDGTDIKAEDKTGFMKVSDNVIGMHAADGTVFLIKEDNTLWGYGQNRKGQLGNKTITGSNDTSFEESLTKILDDVKFVTATKSGDVVLAVRSDNSLYGWGTLGFYTEDQGWIEDAISPFKIMDNVKRAAVDGVNGFVVKTDNTLWGWGESYEDNSVSDEKVVYKIADHVLSITLGERHASIIKDDHTLWVMGGNYRKGLGYASDAVNQSPLKKVLDNIQDAPVSWAKEAVEKAIGLQLIPDNMQNNYGQSITREEFCILAVRLIEKKSGMSVEEYIDVRGLEMLSTSPFVDCTTKDVMAAYVLGVVSGTSATTFDPSRQLVRQEAAVMLSNTAKAVGRDITAETPNYGDLSDIANWAKPSIGYVYDINVMRGVGDNNFGPIAGYQRQQAFLTMYKIWQSIDAVSLEKIEN